MRSPSRNVCFINENNSMGQSSKFLLIYVSGHAKGKKTLKTTVYIICIIWGYVGIFYLHIFYSTTRGISMAFTNFIRNAWTFNIAYLRNNFNVYGI